MTTSGGETQDQILGGAITIVQPQNEYRFSVDSVLIARFATARTTDRVLELGAGCGVISLIIAMTARPCEITAIEIQPQLAEMGERNARINGIVSLRSVCADLRSGPIAGVREASFDLVIANPPFHARNAGRESPNRSRRQARRRRIDGRIRGGGAPLRSQRGPRRDDLRGISRGGASFYSASEPPRAEANAIRSPTHRSAGLVCHG